MQYKIFVIPIKTITETENELNSFLIDFKIYNSKQSLKEIKIKLPSPAAPCEKHKFKSIKVQLN